MNKKSRGIVSILLCAAIVCTALGIGYAFSESDHDHDHENENGALDAVLASPMVTARIDSEIVPLADGAEVAADGQPAPAPEVQAHEHTWGPMESKTMTDSDCTSGLWVAYQTCTVCGARQEIAYRDGIPHHQLETYTYTDPVCSGNQRQAQRCTICGAVFDNSRGGHQWSEWAKTPLGGECQGAYTEERHCTYNCGATEQRTTGSANHQWKTEVLSQANCTQGGKTIEKCAVCGATRNEKNTPAVGHRFNTNTEDCTKERTCTVCGAVDKGYTSHNFKGAYSYDDSGHWQQCSRCSVTSGSAAHTRAVSTDCTVTGKCTVCGAPSVATGLEHNYTKIGSTNLNTHVLRCSNPNCQASKTEQHYSNATPKCGEAVWCDVCNSKISNGSGSHSWSGWTASSSGHSRTCTKCGATETASHTGRKASGGGCTPSITCTTCGYVLSQGYSSHSFGVWMSNGSTHYRQCTHPGCTAQESSAHIGGSATCASAAVCSVCGASYGNKSSTNHVGGTEVRNAKSAEIGKTGYTGDTYCLGCNKQLKKGTTIAALKEEHKHSYGSAWLSDSSGHWHVCSCGERSGQAAHSFSNGKCSVCGAADPNYKVCSGSSHVGGTELRNAKPAEKGKAGYTGDLVCTACGKTITKGTTIPALKEEHKHEFSKTWRSDSVSHWHDCTCGEKTDLAAHSYVNGHCSVCGAADPTPRVCSGSSHIGGTELRNAKPASVGKAGYTGDLVCTACGQVVTKGSDIAALKEDHKHEYSGAWRSDSVSHWHECSCGSIKDDAPHKFVNGKCTICWTKDPNQENHNHTYGQWVFNGKDHWRECSVCGEQADRTAHVLLNDKCLDCGYAKTVVTKYKDVSQSSRYYEAIKQVVEAGILLGAEEVEFQPESAVERSELVEAIYRLAGSPSSGKETGFNDVDADESYAQAVAWVTSTEIFQSNSNDFGVDREATLQETVTFLWRYAKLAGWELEDGAEDVADEAMAWAAASGMMGNVGTANGQLAPEDALTRAEAAVILANFMAMAEANSPDDAAV